MWMYNKKKGENVMQFKAWDGNSIIHVRKLECVPAWRSTTGEKGYNINDHLGIPEKTCSFYLSFSYEHKRR